MGTCHFNGKLLYSHPNQNLSRASYRSTFEHERKEPSSPSNGVDNNHKLQEEISVPLNNRMVSIYTRMNEQVLRTVEKNRR